MIHAKGRSEGDHLVESNFPFDPEPRQAWPLSRPFMSFPTLTARFGLPYHIALPDIPFNDGGFKVSNLQITGNFG